MKDFINLIAKEHGSRHVGLCQGRLQALIAVVAFQMPVTYWEFWMEFVRRTEEVKAKNTFPEYLYDVDIGTEVRLYVPNPSAHLYVFLVYL